MIARMIIVFCLLAVSAQAGDLTKNWSIGHSETLTFDINVYSPKKVTNTLTVTFTRQENNEGKPVFSLDQKIEVHDQEITLLSKEIYEGNDLEFVMSRNTIMYPQELTEKMGTDSLSIWADVRDDSLQVRSDHTAAPPTSMPVYDGLITTAGSLLTSRSKNFTPGSRNEFAFVNLLLLTGKPFQAYPAADSVIGLDTITVPAGTFECYKVRNDVSGAYGYSYFATDSLYTPIKTEMLNINTGETITELVLTKKE